MSDCRKVDAVTPDLKICMPPNTMKVLAQLFLIICYSTKTRLGLDVFVPKVTHSTSHYMALTYLFRNEKKTNKT